MSKTVLLAAAAAFALTAGGASAHALPTAKASTSAPRVVHFAKKSKVIYAQNSSIGTNSGVSDNFTSGEFGTGYNDAAADDFVVPSGGKWKISEVDVNGTYGSFTGPATSENVTFYEDNKGAPGKMVKHGSFTGLTGTDTGGSFAIALPNKVKLKAGTYWVSVVANMDFEGGPGEWYWDEETVQNNNPAQWQNPGGGFGVGCTSWGSMESCIDVGPDLAFQLQGKS